jgi:hypothetical protein
VNLGPVVNSSSWDLSPNISADGSMLYFGSGRPGGIGSGDIWQAPIIPVVDFNGDGIVDLVDLTMLIDGWGTDTSLYDIGPMPWGDGMVDSADLEVFMSYWGQEPYDPTLMAHWTLDETEGSTARDSAGDHDGLLIGQPLWLPVGGHKGGALQLDGVAAHVQTAPILEAAAGPFSVFAWVRGGAPNQVIVAQTDGTDWLLAGPGGTLATLLKGPGAGRGSGLLASSITITDGMWHSVGLAWDGAVRTLYVDGLEVAQDTQLQGSQASFVNGLYLGAGSTLAPGSFWSGLIDDVRIYNRAVRP